MKRRASALVGGGPGSLNNAGSSRVLDELTLKDRSCGFPSRSEFGHPFNDHGPPQKLMDDDLDWDLLCEYWRPMRHGRDSGAIAPSEARDKQHSRQSTRVAAPTPESGANPSAVTPPPCLGPQPATGHNRTAPRNSRFQAAISFPEREEEPPCLDRAERA
jgi:hypothetical protein